MEGIKTLVVYYSRTGVTKKVGESIAKALDCDVEEIIDSKDRKGVIGYMLSGRDALRKKMTEIKNAEKDPAGYELVIIGGPVWAGCISPAIRTYIEKHKDKFSNVAFFCTQGSTGSEGTMKQMEELCGIEPKGKLCFSTKEVMKEDINKKLNDFVNKLK